MPPASPYVGAEPLSHDNPIFGRDREIRDLYFLLSKERIALLYSPSGAGKSSILYARNGLLEQFVDRFDVLPVTRVNTETKLGGVNRYALSMLHGLERFADAPRKESELAALSLRDAIVNRPGRTEGQLTMIVVDQFEEIVRIDPTDIDGKREFFRQLGELLAEPSIWALFVLREDFVATLDPYIRQLPTHLKNRYRIDLLKPEEAVKAIAGPAEKLERKWVPEAATKLAQNLSAETGAVEPMHLQIVCQDIWEGMPDDDMQVDPEDVTEFGDVDKVLGRFYGRIVGDAAKLGHDSERQVRNWVGTKLVVTGGVRGQVLAADARLHGKTIEILDQAHLIRREPRRGADWLELAHDRLVPAVTKNNAAWFADSNNLSDLERRAEQWDVGGRGDDLLADRWRPYQALRAWAKANPERVKEAERSFLKASGKRVWSILKWRAVIAVAMLGSWLGVGYLEKEKERAQAAEKLAVEAKLEAIAAKTAALIEADKAQIAGEEALGDKQVAEHAALRASFSTATLLNERAEQAIESKDYAAAWIYTLAGLAADWPEGAVLHGLVGRMMRTEIRPDRQWKTKHLESVGAVATKEVHQKLGTEIVAVTPRGPIVEYVVSLKSAKGIEYLSGERGPGARSSPAQLPGVMGSFLVRYFPAAKQFVKADRDLVTPLTTRQTAKPPDGPAPPFAAMAERDDLLAVADSNGEIRFEDRTMKRVPDMVLKTSFGPSAMAFNRRNSNYFALGRGDGAIALFIMGKESARLKRLAQFSTGTHGIRSLTFLKKAPDILVAGTENGQLYFLSWRPSGEVRVLESAGLHDGPITALIDDDEKDALISVSKNTIRRTPLTFIAAGWKVGLLELMRDPRGESSLRLYRHLLADSKNTLLRTVSNNRVIASGDAERIPEADRLYFGAEPISLPYRMPKGEFVRLPDGKWQWEREGRVSVLNSQSGDGPIRAVDPQSKLEFVLPTEIRPGSFVTLQKGSFICRAAVEKADSPSAGRIPYEETYIEYEWGTRWKLRSPGVRFGNPQTLHESPDSNTDNVIFGNDGVRLQFPRQGGPLRLGDVELFNVAREKGPASRSEHVVTERRTIYEKVSINGKGPIYPALPGERLFLDFHWRVEIADRGGRSCPGCFVQYYAGLNANPPIGFSKCFISENMPQDTYEGRNGNIRHQFTAPNQPGLYYITHRQSWEYNCQESQIDRHSTSPRDAIAVIRVAPE
jgi:energy-coupling factor transporter ATP-binding protein EcfA2